MSRWRQRRRREAPLDPLLQSERTVMAWQRTALGMGGISALLLHSGVPVSAVLGAVGIVVGVGLLFLAEHRYENTLERVQRGEPSSNPALMRTLSAAVMVLAVGAIVLVVIPAP